MGDIDWRNSTIHVSRNLVRGNLTTPKNHQNRGVDMSRQLRIGLRLHLRRQRGAWAKLGATLPEWVFASHVGTALDEVNVRKALNRIFDKAGMRRRGPHQLRHSFASLLLRAGEPVTYVSHQLGHKDSAITLRVYAHWLPGTLAAGAWTDSTTPASELPLHRPLHRCPPERPDRSH